jgi:hypothetical protein
VYDSVSKQPLDPVIVELTDVQTGKVIEQSITDLNGRFGFLDRPGRYTINVKKTHYSFPSKKITGAVDGMFENLYHGQVITVISGGDVITPNIPMDPEEFDWNQQDKLRIVEIHPKLEFALRLFLQTLFWAGAVLVLLIFIAHTNLVNGLFFLLYLLLAVLRSIILRIRLWGRIVSSSVGVDSLYLEMSPQQFPSVVIAKTVTNQNGKFFLKAIPGAYFLKIKNIQSSTNETLSTKLLATKEIVVKKDGVVNGDIQL